ncbi:MAG: DUF1572 family protein [Planctomycetota bacterium]|nr:DUF1572 family protein [Planctomycetota bacterium]
MDTAASFTRECAGYLRNTYVPRLERALAALPAGDLWWQPHPGAISFGIVLRHLEGNVRQWIVAGLGGQPDHRQRETEFAGPGPENGAELLARLRATVEEACAVIEALDQERLEADHSIQGDTTSGLEAVLHVVEHFSWHTGQAVWIAKARAGADHGLAFYDNAAINAAENDS